jgi:hypothetical protein
MKLYFEIDSLKGLISGYVESRYWYINKDYRQSDEYNDKDIYQKFEFLIHEFGAKDFEAFLISREKECCEEE